MRARYNISLYTNGSGLLKAVTWVGALRGLETFVQLVDYTPQGSVVLKQLPISIRDQPRWHYRGLKVDTSRHFLRIAELRKIILAMEVSA